MPISSRILQFIVIHTIKGFGIVNKAEVEVKRKQTNKKGLNDLDNHNGVVTHLELDILKYEVKWALGSITTRKLMEVMECQLSYVKS